MKEEKIEEEHITGICEQCGVDVAPVVETFSKKNFKDKIFCRKCQDKVRAMLKTAQQAEKQTDETESKVPTGDSYTPNKSKKHIIILQGKEFITHAGLLDIAHKKGIKSIETELLESIEDSVVFRATVTMKDGSFFTGYGDANKSNINSMVLPHKIRMAETRAINRSLRFATNIGMCSFEEMGGDK